MEFDEFVKVMGNIYKRKFTDEEMHKAFQCFDTDNSGTSTLCITTIDTVKFSLLSFVSFFWGVCFKGFITVDELHQVFRQLNPNINEKHVNQVLSDIDTDHDGKISYEEFARMLEEV